MERCVNCQNILPRTVDRCPVCGHAVLVPETEASAPATSKGPGWAAGSSLTRRGQAVPPPELKPREAEGPRTVSRSTPAEVSDARKVLAASSRIEANIQIGPTTKHGIYTLTASALAVIALIAGAVLGYPNDETVAAPTDLPTPSTLAITDTNDFLIDADGVAIVAAPSIVQLTLSGCGSRSKTHGFITENSLIVTSRAAMLRDVTPVATLSDGSEIPVQVIGWSRDLDIAVLSASSSLPDGLTWGSSRRLKVQGEVAVIEAFLDKVSGRNARISDVETRDGLVKSFGFEDVSLLAGSPAVNEFTSIVGVINSNGRLVPVEDIRQIIGEYRVEPQNLSSECN